MYRITGFDQGGIDSQVENWLARCSACRQVISIGDMRDTSVQVVCSCCGVELDEDRNPETEWREWLGGK
jgi:rRNA maturation endonuclease Nob1